MGSAGSRYCRAATDTQRHLLIAYHVNDPRVGTDLLQKGAEGVEFDVVSDGKTWYVHHDLAQGCRVEQYMAQMKNWPQWPVIVYVDIKTPAADNLSELYTLTQPMFPDTQFVYSTAQGRDARQLLRLPESAILCVDFAGQEEAHAVFAAHNRRFWLSDGLSAGLPSPTKVLRTPWPWLVEGRVAWTYSNLQQWETAVVELQLDASIVTAALLPDAARIVRQYCTT